MSGASYARLHTAPAGRLGDARLLKGFIVPEGCAAGVLTWPVKDYDGDTVNPTGGRWRLPLTVNFEHAIPVGTGEVTLKALPDDDGNLVTVPIGTTRFAACEADLRGLDLTIRDAAGRDTGRQYKAQDCLDCAEDIAPLVLKGVLSGLSVEFKPLVYDEGRVNHATRRKSMQVHEWEGFGWAHCRDPRNDYARLFGKAFKSELVRKSFSAPGARSTTVSVPRSVKAMDPTTTAPPMDTPPADPPMDTPPMGDGTPPEIETIEGAAQAMADMAAQFRDTKTLDDKTRKVLGKWADAMEKLAAEKTAHAESLRAKLDAGGPEPADDDADADAEPTDDAAPEETDDEKLEKSFGTSDPRLVLKAFRGRKDSNGLIVFKAGHTARRRWKAAEAVDPPAATAPAKFRPKVSVIADRIRARQAAAR